MYLALRIQFVQKCPTDIISPYLYTVYSIIEYLYLEDHRSQDGDFNSNIDHANTLLPQERETLVTLKIKTIDFVTFIDVTVFPERQQARKACTHNRNFKYINSMGNFYRHIFP